MNAASKSEYCLEDANGKLMEASQLVTHCVNKDERLPDIYELLTRSSTNVQGVRVSRDYLYQEEAGMRLNRICLIPEALLGLMEEAGANANVFMGLLAPISRAWLSIGSKLYMWSFGEKAGKGGSDLTMFEKEGDSIIDVFVMRPKKGVFVEGISWLLVVTSVTQVSLLGITLEDNTLTLHKTGLAFSSDNASVLSVAALEGRLFAGGNDGNVYELEYSSEAKWFSKRCRRVNKTGSTLAYILPSFLTPSFSPIIDLAVCKKRSLLFSLSEDGVIIAYHLKDSGFVPLGSVRVSNELSRMNPASVKLVGINGIEESPFISAVVFANDGTRIYLSCISHFIPDKEQSFGVLPSILSIAFIKAAPEDPGMRDPRRLVHKSGPTMQVAFERGGLFLSSWGKTVMEDALALVQINYPAVFSTTVTMAVECCCYDRFQIEGKIWDIQETAEEKYLSALTSFPVPQRQVLVMSNAGVYIYDILSPQDHLAQALSVGNVQDERVKGFFELYTLVQACAVSLGLASELESLSKGVQSGIVLWSKTAAQLYGAQKDQQGVTNSPLLEGLFSVAARIVAPFWKLPLETQSIKAAIESTEASLHVSNLTTFIGNNLHLWVGSKMELPMVYGLRAVLERVIELSAFLSICVDYGVISNTSSVLPVCSFESVLMNPVSKAFITELVDGLMARQLKMQSGVESLCAVLLQRCPTLFKESQVTLYEGVEALERARRCRNMNSDERQEYLRNALEHFVKAANVLTIRTFDKFVDDFKAMGAYPEIVLLGVSFAQAADPKDEAVSSYYQHQQQPWTVSEAVASRLHAYDSIIQNAVLVVCQSEFSASLTMRSLDALRQSVMSTIAKCRDELLHVKVLDWVMGSQLRKEQLILGELSDSKYLENYLVQRFQLNDAESGDLLWKYYGRQERFVEAAQVLGVIASSVNLVLSLQKRIEALSRAIAMGRSSPKKDGLDICELEDRLEVALIQLELYEVLKKDELNATLLSLSDLFNRYSKMFGLTEISLRIVQCAGHYDAVLVSELWRQVFSSTEDANVLAQKLKRLFTRFSGEDSLVPLQFVVELMLRYAQEHLMSAGWISSIYPNGERLLEVLMQAYDKSGSEYILEEIESIVRLQGKQNRKIKAFVETKIIPLATNYPKEWKTKLSSLI